MSVIFVKPRHFYGTYVDYFRLVELAGYPVIYEDEMDLSNPEHCYILSWFSAQSPFPDDIKARLICWNLEWADVPILPGVEYWSPDKWYAEQHDWKYVPVGSDSQLRFDYPRFVTMPLYDVTLQMYRDVQRRASLIRRIKDCGITVAPDGWGFQRAHSMDASRIQLHIHQHDSQHVVSPLRFAVAASWRMPIITERLNDAGIFNRVVIQSTYDGLPDCLTEYLSPSRRATLHEFGASLHQRLCIDMPFKKVVESSV